MTLEELNHVLVNWGAHLALTLTRFEFISDGEKLLRDYDVALLLIDADVGLGYVNAFLKHAKLSGPVICVCANALERDKLSKLTITGETSPPPTKRGKMLTRAMAVPERAVSFSVLKDQLNDPSEFVRMLEAALELTLTKHGSIRTVA